MPTLRESIVAGALSVWGVVPDEDKIAAIEQAAIGKPHPMAYAFRAGRNAAIDAWRADQAAARMAARQDVRMAEEIEERRRAAEAAVLKSELQDELVRWALRMKNPRHQAGLLSFIDPTGARGLVERHGVTPDVAYQWRRRGVKSILPQASEALRSALRRAVRARRIAA